MKKLPAATEYTEKSIEFTFKPRKHEIPKNGIYNFLTSCFRVFVVGIIFFLFFKTLIAQGWYVLAGSFQTQREAEELCEYLI